MMAVHEGRVAVVTGAGSGIGAAMCRRFAREGARVVVFDIRGAEDIAEELGEAGLAITGSVAESADVQGLFARALATFGAVDIVCNNAGITYAPTPVDEVDDDDYDRMQAVNARGVFLGIKYGARAIRSSSGAGAIVNTASTSSFLALPGRTAYASSKGAVAMMTKNAAVDLASEGIRVNAICPGPTRTGIFDAAIVNIPDVEQRMAASVPLGRVAEPDEIATVASFLAGDGASFITGALLSVDGGVSCVHVH
jgi:NAD(P)-dependent dehydrogenase (short-subunit alcohol dehydrogenase family)